MSIKILSIDPSGNFKEGKGTTGVCIMLDGNPIELSEIKAVNYDSAEGYWDAHVEMIMKEYPDEIVMEGYRLYNHKGKKASMQANSELETPQLIGIIKLLSYQWKIPLKIQYAADVKTRWSDNVLVHNGFLEQRGTNYMFDNKRTSTHKRDALRHALHYWRYTRVVN